jgi:general secretion pathway protein J
MTPRRSAISGFTLVEVLVATALMGIVLAALATITAQWLPNWDRGLARVQRNELLDIGVQRVVGDLAASEFIPPNGRTMRPLFEGAESSVIFVRSAIGPNARPGLEIVRLAEESDARGVQLVRSRAAFVPMPPQAPPASQSFTDPVALVRSPARVSFSYAGRDRVWRSVWHNERTLPSAIRINIRDAATHGLLPASTIVSLHIDTSALCASTSVAGDCGDDPARPKTDNTNTVSDNSPQKNR